jgi:hypothetical protein
VAMYRDEEIERLVRELAEAWSGDAGVDTGAFAQASNQPRSVDRLMSESDVEVEPANVSRSDREPILNLINASARSQESVGGRGGDSSLGRELSRRTR